MIASFLWRLREIKAFIIDVYLPDVKYGADEPGRIYSGAHDYCRINQAAVAEMLRQVGHLTLDRDGIACSGLILRHLVLPYAAAATSAVLAWIRAACGRHQYLSLMGQYRPCHQAEIFAELAAPLRAEQYAEACAQLTELELGNGWLQPPDRLNAALLPDFRKPDSWN